MTSAKQDRWEAAKTEQGQHSLELGSNFAYQMLQKPRHLLFVLARYKFAARMLPPGRTVRVLELGCGEGLGTLFFAEDGHQVTGVDLDGEAIEQAQKTLRASGITFLQGDILDHHFGEFEAVISLDVVEHIEPSAESGFWATVRENLTDDGFCVIGTPNGTAAAYASSQSKIAHVNLFTAERLVETMRRHFRNVFLFGMNDEVLHTGFYPMSHYLFALGCGPIDRRSAGDPTSKRG
jgi:2-polyprenyl-3-methyl-5-hydroxy-6-metoxy-1,4-benzoquinol methylase